jgi:hypothetical protein
MGTAVSWQMRLARNSALDQALKSTGMGIAIGILSGFLLAAGAATTEAAAAAAAADKRCIWATVAPSRRCTSRGKSATQGAAALSPARIRNGARSGCKRRETRTWGRVEYAEGAVLQWVEHKDAKAGAAIAYYSIFR